MKVDAAFELLVALSLTLMSSAASINLMLSPHLLVHRFSCCRSGPVSVDAALLYKQSSRRARLIARKHFTLTGVKLQLI